MTDTDALRELIDDSAKLLKTYESAMASQKDHGSDAKLIVMANYGDLCAGRLRAILAALASPTLWSAK